MVSAGVNVYSDGLARFNGFVKYLFVKNAWTGASEILRFAQDDMLMGWLRGGKTRSSPIGG